MARRLAWLDVRGGLLASIILAIVAVLVLTFARVGVLHGDTFPLYAIVGEARGLTIGSEVWLSGQKIGKVKDIEFRPISQGDTNSRLLIELTILERYRNAMHRDAEGQVKAGGSFIGAPVVYVSPGTRSTPVIRSGDTLRTTPQGDIEEATSQFAGASKQFPEIISNVKLLTAQLKGTGGTVGAFLSSPGGGELTRARVQASRLMNTVSNGHGSAALIMRGGLSARASRVMARADSVKLLLASPNSSFGRFRRDSTLMGEVADIRNELSIVQALFTSPDGTVGRAMADSALMNGVAEAQRQMSLLFADIKKHPLRYLVF